MDNTPPAPAVLHIEVQLLPGTVCENRNDLETTIRNWLLDNFAALSLEQVISDFEGSKQLESTIERLMLTEASIEARNPKSGRENIDTAYLEGAVLNLHVYSFQPQASPTAPLAPRGDGDDDELSWIPSSRIIELPARSLDGVWEALVYESNIKSTLLGYLQTLVRFSRGKINLADVSFNRVVLLHGPPGSGKTSLARGLAQKLSIRFSRQYARFQLLEINGSSLFSKYYSESGKIVARMFDWILGLVADPAMFVVVLIDEIETLIASRQSSGEDARESLRVVNALLTGIDKLLAKPNVLILTTSNIIQIMDPAFLDRVDINELVDSPHIPAAYTILRSCLNKMLDCGIISGAEPLPSATEASLGLFSMPDIPASRLWGCASKSVGFSGRALRKLTGLMYIKYIHAEVCSMDEAVRALGWTVDDELERRGGERLKI